MDSPNQEESTLISNHPVNYYAVYNNKNKAVIYTGTNDECKLYIKTHELTDCVVWHIHDIAIHSKPVYLSNQE